MKEMNVKLGENKGNVRMILSDGTPYPERGSINFADRQVDPSTGAMTFEAVFKNEGNLLRPGQYVKLGLVTEFRRNALLIPQRSVNEMQGMFQVFTLADSNKLELKLVKVGPAYNMSYVIEDGIKNNEKIVIGGTQMLRNGMVITPNVKTWSPDSTNISSLMN